MALSDRLAGLIAAEPDAQKIHALLMQELTIVLEPLHAPILASWTRAYSQGLSCQKVCDHPFAIATACYSHASVCESSLLNKPIHQP